MNFLAIFIRELQMAPTHLLFPCTWMKLGLAVCPLRKRDAYLRFTHNLPSILGKLGSENNSLSWENCIFLQGYSTSLGDLDYSISWTRDESKGEMALGHYQEAKFRGCSQQWYSKNFQVSPKADMPKSVTTSKPGKKRTVKQVRAEEVGTVRSLCVGRFRAGGRQGRPEGTSWSREQMTDTGSL